MKTRFEVPVTSSVEEYRAQCEDPTKTQVWSGYAEKIKHDLNIKHHPVIATFVKVLPELIKNTMDAVNKANAEMEKKAEETKDPVKKIKHGVLTVTASIEKGQILIEILDHGPGFPAKMVNADGSAKNYRENLSDEVEVTKTKSDKVEKDQAGGRGLGLSSAQYFLESFQGDSALYVANKDGHAWIKLTSPVEIDVKEIQSHSYRTEQALIQYAKESGDEELAAKIQEREIPGGEIEFLETSSDSDEDVDNERRLSATFDIEKMKLPPKNFFAKHRSDTEETTSRRNSISNSDNADKDEPLPPLVIRTTSPKAAKTDENENQSQGEKSLNKFFENNPHTQPESPQNKKDKRKLTPGST